MKINKKLRTINEPGCLVVIPLFIIIMLLLVDCSPKSDSVQLYTTDDGGRSSYSATTPRFAEGDIAYLKPDSLKVVVTSVATSVYKGQQKTVHTYYYYYHVTTAEDGTYKKTGRQNEKFFH